MVLIRIIKEYLNKQKPLDGEVFRKIQYYYLKNDTKSENRWWALLDRSKLNNLRQLLKNSHFARAFNALVEMLGL